MDLPKIFTCNICSKNYKHRQSLRNHNKKFHTNITQITPNNSVMALNDSVMAPVKSNKINKCSFCNKWFSKKSNLNRHINLNRCKNKINHDIDKKQLKQENELLKLENVKLKENMQNELDNFKKQIMDVMIKKCKIHPKTLQKINNQMNNCNITNINIVQLGNENIMETLSKKEKLKILSHCYGSFDKLIECVHFNPKYPQFKNIAITNLKDDYAYKYDEQQNKFIACKKEELLEDLLDNRVIDLEEILDENVEHINNVKVSKLKDFVDKLYDKNLLYNTKKSDIKLLIYNKCDKNTIKV